MDNAAKALIIAGAILISILLIAISMYVYNSAQGTVNQAGAQMTAQEKDMYNSKINSYVGASKPGIDVRSLIDAVISSNNGNMTDSGKFISIEFTGFQNTTALAANGSSAAVTSPIGTAGESNNTADYVKTQSNLMLKLKSAVNTGKRYNISTDSSSTGLIIKVLIEEIN